MKRTKYFFLMMILFGSLAWAQTGARELAFSDWGVNVEPSVITKAFSKEAVRDFIDAFIYAVTGEPTLLRPKIHEVGINDLAWSEVRRYKSTLPEKLGTVGALKWADVDADGVYELLVTLDVSGRAFYNNLFIVKQVAGAYRQQKIFINNAETFMDSLDELRKSHSGHYSICDRGCTMVISDLDHDGTLELILPIEIGGYRGASLTPNWPSIYKWEEYGYIEADGRFKGSYEEILLPDIDKKIEALSRGKSEAAQDLDEELTTEWVIRDRIVRFLGRDPQAGLRRAIGWTKSANMVVRQNAAFVFSEIPGEEAGRYLEELAADPNIDVRSYARSVQRERREKARE